MKNKKAGAEAPTKRQKKNTTKQAIVSILKKNRQGVTREEFRRLLNIEDRALRIHIAELRDQGFMIGTTATGGYTIDKVRDFERTLAFYEAKANQERQRIRKMKRTLELRDQVKMKF